MRKRGTELSELILEMLNLSFGERIRKFGELLAGLFMSVEGGQADAASVHYLTAGIGE